MPDWLIGLLGITATSALGYLTVLATRRSGDRERIKNLEIRTDKLEATSARKSDYIEDLRAHINNGKGPPAPPYPEHLFD